MVYRELVIDSIIFDIDGTIWDSRETVAKAWNDARRKAFPDRSFKDVTADELSSLFGKTMDVLCRELLPGIPESSYEEFTEVLYPIQAEHVRKEPGRLYDGVPETLEKLCGHFPLFIVSNCQKGYPEDMFYSTGLEKYFKDWLCYGDTGLPKNGTMKLLIEKNKLKAPVYVGDTAGDAEASRLAGVPFIWASYGLGHAEKSECAGRIDSFPELTSLI